MASNPLLLGRNSSFPPAHPSLSSLPHYSGWVPPSSLTWITEIDSNWSACSKSWSPLAPFAYDWNQSGLSKSGSISHNPFLKALWWLPVVLNVKSRLWPGRHGPPPSAICLPTSSPSSLASPPVSLMNYVVLPPLYRLLPLPRILLFSLLVLPSHSHFSGLHLTFSRKTPWFTPS